VIRDLALATIESLGDGLIVTEPSSTTIAAVNPRARQLVPDLIAGAKVDSPSSPLPPLDMALQGEAIVEHRGRTLAVTATRLVGERDGVVWTVRDVSERARLDRARNEFIATASHELRSPLTSIKGFVELLARSPEGISKRQREFVEIVLRSTDRLVDLVNDLLDVARIDADGVEINRRPIDVGEAIREVVELMGPRIAAKRQHLGTYIAPTLPLALADPGRVRQIVANLLTNAHLYTPADGRIHVGVEAERARIQIVVQDSGVGMTALETKHVFERFYRGPGEGGGGAHIGTGLGLSIVKSLVELHEGEIEVESEPGRGSTFRVLLPVAVATAESVRPLEMLGGSRVLVVDDEPHIADLIAGQLTQFDVQVTTATNGKRALELLRAEPYDAVTLDLLMPEMDGLEVVRQIRDDPELRALPIVFVSVVPDRSEVSGEWIVSKPIDADELRDVLGTAIRSGRSRVLVVGREQLQPMLEPVLDDLGIEHQWESTAPAAARACSERRFEVALIDVGVRSPQAVLEALDARGRRLRRKVILFSDEARSTSKTETRFGLPVVTVDDAAEALLLELRGEPNG
jgi:signal transduction histidine kinase/CheY-like chemotaxis protein